jgi:hypothetical protein
MLAKLKTWWPLVSGLVVAASTIASKLFAAQSQLFLVARLFRYELLALILLSFVVTGFQIVGRTHARWRPRVMVKQGVRAVRNIASRQASGTERVAGAILLTCSALFVLELGSHVLSAQQFLRERYDDADRQSLLAEAVQAEEQQKLLEAVATYRQVMNRFPRDDYNYSTEQQIATVEERYRNWVATSRIAQANARGGMALTKYDQLLDACRYVTRANPCLKIEDYLQPVETVMKRAGQGCVAIAGSLPASSMWILLDPNDAKWLRAKDGASICQALNLTTGPELRNYLDKRWRVTAIREWQHPSAQPTR